MSPKSNLNVKIQMSRPNKCTDNIKSNSTCTFLSVRTKLKTHFALGHCIRDLDSRENSNSTSFSNKIFSLIFQLPNLGWDTLAM